MWFIFRNSNTNAGNIYCISAQKLVMYFQYFSNYVSIFSKPYLERGKILYSILYFKSDNILSLAQKIILQSRITIKKQKVTFRRNW